MAPYNKNPSAAELAALIQTEGRTVTDSADPAEFDAIFLDTRAARTRFVEAGYWLARGKLVAVVARSESWWTSTFAGKMGGWAFRDYPEFCGWLRTGKKSLTYQDVQGLPMGPRQLVDPNAQAKGDEDATDRIH
jgi:hypothetical protein